MIRIVTSEDELRDVLAVAESLEGENDLRLSQSWLGRSDIFALPEEGEWRAYYESTEQLDRVQALWPDARWYGIELTGLLGSEPPFEVTDLAHHTSIEGPDSLGHAFDYGMSLLLFCVNYPAAILYTAEDVRMVSGSAEFVHAYFGDSLKALFEYIEYVQENIDGLAKTGSDVSMDSEVRKLRSVLGQVKLPPSASVA